MSYSVKHLLQAHGEHIANANGIDVPLSVARNNGEIFLIDVAKNECFYKSKVHSVEDFNKLVAQVENFTNAKVDEHNLARLDDLMSSIRENVIGHKVYFLNQTDKRIYHVKVLSVYSDENGSFLVFDKFKPQYKISVISKGRLWFTSLEDALARQKQII